MKTKKKLTVCVLICVILISNVYFMESKNAIGKTPFFTIIARPMRPYSTMNYYGLIVNQLAKVGIRVDILICDCPLTTFPIVSKHGSTDLVVVELSKERFNPTLWNMFSENGSFNSFWYDTSMDWDEQLGTGKNQWYLEQLHSLFPPDSEERIELYREWENYFMDNILFMQPLVNNKIYTKYWDNLQGYNFTEGLLQSWGKMSWDGTHPSQNNISEIVTSDTQWTELNPLLQNPYYSPFGPSSFMSNLVLDPLFWLDSDYSIKPHLAESYSMINNTHVRINLREGIKWQSDFDGNFTDEYFDAEDVYFTLNSCYYPIAINPKYRLDWLKDMTIIDPYTIDLFIDGEFWTPENEPYAQFLEELNIMMLPEHYLNQTQNEEGEPILDHLSWTTYSDYCFGTGLFEIKSNYTGFETILNVNPDCWWLNSTITSDSLLDWENRFGLFTSYIPQLRVNVHTDSLIAHGDFENGLLDILLSLGSKPNSSIDCNIQEKMGFVFTFLGYSLREVDRIIGSREPCKDDPSITKGLAVRKAISYAIDRDEFNQIVYSGEGCVVDNPFYEARKIWSDPNIIQYNHDLEMAKYYLELAGFATVISGFEIFDLFQISFSVLVVILVFKRKQIKNKM